MYHNHAKILGRVSGTSPTPMVHFSEGWHGVWTGRTTEATTAAVVTAEPTTTSRPSLHLCQITFSAILLSAQHNRLE